MSTLARQLAEWVHGLTLASLPDEVVSAGRRCIVDATGVALAAASDATSRTIQSLVVSERASGEAAVWGGDGVTSSAPCAAFCNGTAAHVLDYDDTCYDGIVHGTAAVWPAVFACAEVEGASGGRVLEAFIAGVETEYALGRALSDAVYFNGWWTSGLLGSIGAAAGAAKALRLDLTQTQHAIALAACQATGLRAMIGTAAKPYALGRAAQAGVHAALAARAGIDAPADAFESPRGFINVIASGAFDASRVALGKRFSLVAPGIAFKLYPACSATQAATEAVLELIAEHGLAAEDIAAVDCEVTPLVAISLMYDRPTTVTEAQFSLPYAIACAIRYADFGVRQMREPSFGDADTLAVMQKVSMVRSDTLEATEELRRQNPEGARVTIRLTDGRAFTRYNAAATGMPQKPMSDAALDRKFLACATTAMAERDARGLLERLRTIERCDNVRGLVTSASSGTSPRT